MNKFSIDQPIHSSILVMCMRLRTIIFQMLLLGAKVKIQSLLFGFDFKSSERIFLIGSELTRRCLGLFAYCHTRESFEVVQVVKRTIQLHFASKCTCNVEGMFSTLHDHGAIDMQNKNENSNISPHRTESSFQHARILAGVMVLHEKCNASILHANF